MAAPTLTTEQKKALYDLMTDYFNAKTSFIYRGKARRESYASVSKIDINSTGIDGCMDSSTGKYFLNCGLFAQMIWMGRSIADYATTPVNKITKKFNWGYYFDFDSAKRAYAVYRDETATTDKSKYYLGFNTYKNASGKNVFITFDNAASMAQELYNKGCEIPYGEADIGDLVFYRATSLIDGDSDDLEESSFKNISHVGIVYSKTAEGTPIIMEYTDVYNAHIGKCSTAITAGETKNPESLNDKYGTCGKVSMFGNIRGANLDFRNVMCARHPVAFNKSGNVPTKFAKYRGTEVQATA